MRYIACLAFIIFLITGCVKYPDGGNNASALDGPYGITELKVNGIDSASAIHFPMCSPYYIFFNSFVFNANGKITNGCDTMPTATWFRSTDRKRIIITCAPTPGGKPVYPFLQNRDCTVVWDIQRLTNEDLWMKTTYNGKEYYIKFAYQH